MLNAHITNLLPSRLFLIRWICYIAGCTLRVWKAKPRVKKELSIRDQDDTPSSYICGPSTTAATTSVAREEKG